MAEENESRGGLIPPGKLLHSFFLVAGIYSLFLICVFGSFIAIAKLFFPDIFELMLDTETLTAQMEKDPASVFPRPMFFSWLAVNAVICVCLGWSICRLAPFGKFAHAIFLAALIGVGFFQAAIGAQREIVWMFVVMMGAFPITVLLGANFAVGSANGRT